MRDIIASRLVKMARKLVFDTDIVFVRGDDADDHVFNKVNHDIQSFIDRIRRNEDVETYTGRRDNGRAMEISIGVASHEAKDAILRDVIAYAEKLGKRNDIKVMASDEVDYGNRPQ